MDMIDETGYLIRVGRSVDPVAEVENVPRLRAGFLEYPVDATPQLVRRREQGGRVEIALYRLGRTQGRPCCGERRSPIHSHDVGSKFGNVRQQRRALVREVDERQLERSQPIEDSGHRRYGEAAVVVRAEQPGPLVEEHQCLRSGRGLCCEIGDGHLGEFLQQPHRRRRLSE